MDKQTLSNYGWIVIAVLVLAVMIALATPFGLFVTDAIKSTTAGLFDVNQSALGAAGINISNNEFDDPNRVYVDFIITRENRSKIGYTDETTDLVISETFYDEVDGVWYKVVGIADGVDGMGEDGAFYKSYNLKSVEIPGSVSRIGDFAFCMCMGVERLVIHEGVQEIGDFAFKELGSLNSTIQEIVLPNSLTTIGLRAFAMSSIVSINIPDNIINIDKEAFNCSKLTSVTFGENSKLVSIEDGVFAYCKFESIEIPNSITRIGYAACGLPLVRL